MVEENKKNNTSSETQKIEKDEVDTSIKEDKIEVEKSTIEEILQKQKIQDKTIEKQASEIERLTSAADVGRLARYDMDNSKELIRKAKVALIEHDGEPRIVLGWESTTDRVYFENGVHKFEQKAKYILDMGEGKEPFILEMDQRNWYREINREIGEIIKESNTPDGKSTRTLRFKNGREIEFDATFINP